MITIFVLLGLSLLGGGAAAIVDGLPYMMLERGFTQVIIGSVSATGGVLLLAMAWVLVEIRRVKSALSNAAIAMSMASVASARSESEAPAAVEKMLPGLLPAAIGAAAVAGAMAASTQASAAGEPAHDPALEPDLFDRPLEANADEVSKADAVDPGAEARPDPIAEETTKPDASEPDWFAPSRQAESDPSPVIENEPVAAGKGDDEFGFAAALAAAQELEPSKEPEASAASKPAESDEFSYLRDSLAASLREPDPAETRLDPPLRQETLRQEPLRQEPLHQEPLQGLDDLDAAQAWMEPPPPRREPWFGEPATAPLDEPVLPPLWPPQTREPAAFTPVPEPDEAQGRAGAAVPADEMQPLASDRGDDEPVAEPGKAIDDEPARDEPAASDEGVVGAYQVGDTYFTLYADGSIQARTPDGDYSFASMDELKVYLASERSRLGV